MTDWPEFFRILCRHSTDYRMTLPYEAAVAHPGQDALPGILYMVPFPEGDGMSTEAREWLNERREAA